MRRRQFHDRAEGHGDPAAFGPDGSRWVRVVPAKGGSSLHQTEAGTDVCIVARSLGATGPLSEWLASLGIAVSATKDLGVAIMNLRQSYTAWAAVVIFADGFGGPVECFDQLRLLREECPGLPVILVSGSFAESDFTAERAPLCDVCLRYPIDPSEYVMAWVGAVENSKRWRQFKFEMRKTALGVNPTVQARSHAETAAFLPVEGAAALPRAAAG